jgi:hypothetical protein
MSEYGANIMPNIASLWKRRELCDVVVLAGGGCQFPAHRVVLAAGSSFARALFTGAGTCMRESMATPVVQLQQFEPQWVHMMLEALYGEPIEVRALAHGAGACVVRLVCWGQPDVLPPLLQVGADNVQPLLELSCYLEVQHVVAACCKVRRAPRGRRRQRQRQQRPARPDGPGACCASDGAAKPLPTLLCPGAVPAAAAGAGERGGHPGAGPQAELQRAARRGGAARLPPPSAPCAATRAPCHPPWACTGAALAGPQLGRNACQRPAPAPQPATRPPTQPHRCPTSPAASASC